MSIVLKVFGYNPKYLRNLNFTLVMMLDEKVMRSPKLLQFILRVIEKFHDNSSISRSDTSVLCLEFYHYA